MKRIVALASIIFISVNGMAASKSAVEDCTWIDASITKSFGAYSEARKQSGGWYFCESDENMTSLVLNNLKGQKPEAWIQAYIKKSYPDMREIRILSREDLGYATLYLTQTKASNDTIDHAFFAFKYKSSKNYIFTVHFLKSPFAKSLGTAKELVRNYVEQLAKPKK